MWMPGAIAPLPPPNFLNPALPMRTVEIKQIELVRKK